MVYAGLDDRDVLRDEFINMMLTWEIEEEACKSIHSSLPAFCLLKYPSWPLVLILAGKAYDFITENGKKKMDYGLFCEFIKKFLTNEEPNHPVNCGLC